MRISHVQNNNYNNKYSQLSFGIWQREVYKTGVDGVKKLSHRNYTAFFRDALFWRQLTEFLGQKFSSTDKVNVYCYGCSDGSEPYTFAMELLSKGDNFAQKFLPIQARDFDGIAICKALDGEYELNSEEVFYIEDALGAYNNYFQPGKNKNLSLRSFFDYSDYEKEYMMFSDQLNVKANDVLKKTVRFAMGDILEDYKNIKPDNSVVLARNFWPYIDDSSKRREFFQKLYDHLNKGSFFVIGNFDVKKKPVYYISDVAAEIKNAGFKETEVENVFEKR